MVTTVIVILALSFIQNVAFTLTSRSRNRNNMTYHAMASTFSNGLWFLTMGYLFQSDWDWVLLIPYITGTVSGSLFGAKVSMFIERKIGALADPN